MKQVCIHQWCNRLFDVTDDDRRFLNMLSPVIGGVKYELPEPTLCPECRQQRRFAFRNERHLYHRMCDKTGKKIISQYNHPDIKIYLNSEWWGDSWSALDYGRSFDFSRPFFEQFHEMQKDVPHLGVANDSSNMNSDYANQTGYLKDCYLVFDSDYCEQSLYLQTGKHSISSMDCLRLFHSELCYECIDCARCYRLLYSLHCENCSDGFFLRDCKNCKHCFGCHALRNKEYCMFNEQLTKEEYEKRVCAFQLDTHAGLSHAKKEIDAWFLAQCVPLHHNISVEESTGDFLVQTQRAMDCFDCNDIRDCRYCTNLSEDATDCMDYDVWGYHAQLLYEVTTSGYNTTRNLFCFDCWSDVSEVLYSESCFHSNNLFGCVGLKRNQYCIFNKQYTKEEYETLVPRIIHHMRQTGEWGEFFPVQKGLFDYNKSVAQEYCTLEKQDVVARGWHWQDDLATDQFLGFDDVPPEAIHDVADDITQKILHCSRTGKAYKIIPQELKFYRDMHIPIPRKCPDQRHRERMALRNPRKLFDRTCDKCFVAIRTTYAPERPETVLCEECYLKEVY